ncbi:hypothetical protein [uncultured Tateyamaria sp.]|uniref:hypothetical protein n=1 Tax=uncultured Tateyamaria sp. TaxID=455651 RepID=UPI0026131E6F|nr:hypothetical protein [uncultured Tateyamaria sp.]
MKFIRLEDRKWEPWVGVQAEAVQAAEVPVVVVQAAEVPVAVALVAAVQVVAVQVVAALADWAMRAAVHRLC